MKLETCSCSALLRALNSWRPPYCPPPLPPTSLARVPFYNGKGSEQWCLAEKLKENMANLGARSSPRPARAHLPRTASDAQPPSVAPFPKHCFLR